jgi:hypothetical protein
MDRCGRSPISPQVLSVADRLIPSDLWPRSVQALGAGGLPAAPGRGQDHRGSRGQHPLLEALGFQCGPKRPLGGGRSARGPAPDSILPALPLQPGTPTDPRPGPECGTPGCSTPPAVVQPSSRCSGGSGDRTTERPGRASAARKPPCPQGSLTAGKSHSSFRAAAATSNAGARCFARWSFRHATLPRPQQLT